jgi:hypothetical protein
MRTTSRVLKSSIFLLGIAKAQRSLGTVKTLILTPEHFGVVALVTITQHLFELLEENCKHQDMVKKDNIEGADLNTPFSMHIAIKTGMAIIVVVKTWLKEAYQETPKMRAAAWVALVNISIRALQISRNGEVNDKSLSIRIIFLKKAPTPFIINGTF